MARTYRNIPGQPKLPSPERVALVERGGKGFHGGSKRRKARQDRQATRRELRGAY